MPTATPNGRRVLLVDDAVDIRTLLRVYLEAKDWTVVEARDGGEAATMLRTNTPAAMILDLQMPVISGEELVDMMLRRDAPIVPTVILSGYPRRFEALQEFEWLPCVEKGADFDTVHSALRHAVEVFAQEDVQLMLSMQDDLAKMREMVHSTLMIRRGKV